MHLVLVDLRESEIDGQQSEDRLHEIGITVNRNAVPFDPRPPMVTSGLRVGTSALATRGLQAEDFAEIGEIIATALTPDFDARRGELAERVTAIADALPAVRAPRGRRPPSDAQHPRSGAIRDRRTSARLRADGRARRDPRLRRRRSRSRRC